MNAYQAILLICAKCKVSKSQKHFLSPTPWQQNQFYSIPQAQHLGVIFDSSHSLILHAHHILFLLNLWNILTFPTQKSLPFPHHLMPGLLSTRLHSISASNLCPLTHLLWCYHISHPKTWPLCNFPAPIPSVLPHWVHWSPPPPW